MKIREWLEAYNKGKLMIKELSEGVNISERQAYRIVKRYKEGGILGIQHKGRNKPSNYHIEPAKKLEKIIILPNLLFMLKKLFRGSCLSFLKIRFYPIKSYKRF